MIKTFITAISLQGFGDLEKGIYQPEGFLLNNNRETSFPIIPIIAENMDTAKDVKIIALRTENNDAKDNFQAFVNQLSELGITEEQVVPIAIEENQSKTVGLTAFMRIIDEIPDESLVYADITYGTKPMAAIILYAMSFIEKVNHSETGGIYYGELPRVNRKSDWNRARLYDLTVFQCLSDVLDQMTALEVSNPRAALRKLIGM